MLADNALRAIADQQWGYFTSGQAAAAGFNKVLQHYHVKNGNWQKVERALYRFPGYPETPEAVFTHWSLWAAGQNGKRVVVVSHASALHYLDLGDIRPMVTELTVSALRNNPHSPACRLHLDALAADQYRQEKGFLITTPVRTLRDMRPDLIYAGRWGATVRLAYDRGEISTAEANALLAPETVSAGQRFTLAAAERAGQNTSGLAAAGVRDSTGAEGGRQMTGFAQWRRPGRGEGLVQNRSFTLIEMLVVIAIISILAAMLMPALTKARQTADQTRCASGLRQIGVAIQTYTTDNANVYPYACLNIGAIRLTWDDLINRYLGGDLTQAEMEADGPPISKRLPILKCAADKISDGRSYAMPNPTDSTRGGSLGMGISMPQGCNPENTRWTISSIRVPGKTLLMSEYVNSINMIGKVWGAAFRNPILQTEFPHGNVQPYLFADLHLLQMSPDTTVAEPFTAHWGAYSNPGGIWTVNPSD